MLSHTLTLLTLTLALTLVTMTARADDALAGTELSMSFLVHRHGERTPVASTLPLSTDPAALAQLSAPYGYGQLTDEGKRTGYRVGEWIRARYGELLSAHYNRSEIFVRSTDSTRTKMTVLTALAALYPPTADNWNRSLPWQPTPYTTTAARYDFNLAVLNCPTFVSFYEGKFLTNPARMSRFTRELEQWSALLGFNITQLPVLAYPVYDVYTSQMSLGLPLGAALEELLPSIEAIAGEAIDVVFGNDEYTPLQAGVMLQRFLSAASAAASGGDTQRVHVYSAHDYNVYSLMAVTRVTPRPGVPKYGSVFALELRRVIDSGEYVVLPVYVRSPGAEPEYLRVEGCSALPCALDEFAELTADAALNETQWRQLCEYTDDYEVDESSIA